ncbi:S8 family serine peptidase [Actinomadura violacea]|uniref:S8 family serine peptidase n=1 Tax=Actinomadura violacea TaxID=2819934 RepID=UPI0027DC0346|nr:S8 family serine peptidase [Actinomadura violacea]
MEVLTRARTRRARPARRRGAAAVLAAALAGAWLPLLAPPAHADEIRDRQRGVLDELGMDAAWKVTKGGNVTVAVVDSGVDPNQKDIAGSVTVGPNMLAAIDGGSKPAHLHGTNMTSLIAGHGHGPGGRAGIIGIAPESRVLAIRVIGEKEDPSYARYRSSREAEDAVAKGIRYAADHGADIINLSLGKISVPGRDTEIPAERDAIGYAIGKGVVVVSAVGNNGDDSGLVDGDGFSPYSYPASYPGVIAVAATQPSHERAPFSNRNLSVVLSAPGAGLPVAGPGDSYYVSDGTSDASALVSGIAALIRARHPNMAPALVSQALIESTRFGPKNGYGPDVGFGEVNAERALNAADTLAKGASTASAGRPGGKRFGDRDPGPVTIVHRPVWVTPTVIAVTLIGVGGVVGAAVIALAFHRRHPRAVPAGMAPPGPGSPPGPPGGGFGPPQARPGPGGGGFGAPAPRPPAPAPPVTSGDTPRQPGGAPPAFAPPDPAGTRPPGTARSVPPAPGARPSFGAPDEPPGGPPA